MKASIDARAQTLDTALRPDVQQFESFKTQHPFYNDAFNRTWALSTRGHSSRVVIVCGPTGVGKSTLGCSLQAKANQAMASACVEDPSLVPSVLVKAIAPHGRGFSWKDFYIRTLEQLREPLIERKVFSPQQMTLLGNDVLGKTTADGLDVELLRRSLERAFKHRRTRQLIVDEAHHMLLSTDARHVELQFESLKSLADTCGATLVLVGTYRLLQIREHSAQLIRRSQIVHFPPYRASGTEERRAFKSVLATFAQRLPVPLDTDLAKDVKFFFLKTAGCVGILRDLLRDAVCEAIESASVSISREVVERVAQPNKAIKTILQEAALGAYALEDVSLDEVSSLVEMTPKEIYEAHWREQMGHSGQELPLVPGDATPTDRRRATRRVGQRAPNRDRVEGAARAAFL